MRRLWENIKEEVHVASSSQKYESQTYKLALRFKVAIKTFAFFEACTEKVFAPAGGIRATLRKTNSPRSEWGECLNCGSGTRNSQFSD